MQLAGKHTGHPSEHGSAQGTCSVHSDASHQDGSCGTQTLLPAPGSFPRSHPLPQGSSALCPLPSPPCLLWAWPVVQLSSWVRTSHSQDRLTTRYGLPFHQDTPRSYLKFHLEHSAWPPKRRSKSKPTLFGSFHLPTPDLHTPLLIPRSPHPTPDAAGLIRREGLVRDLVVHHRSHHSVAGPAGPVPWNLTPE